MKKSNSEAILYLKQNKLKFITAFLKDAVVNEPKIAIFTAGASGAGKTEYAISKKEKDPYLVHIDTDEIRKFFEPIGYNGNNSDLYQQAASKGVDILYKEAINKKYSVILDTNFSNENIAFINLQKALKHKYVIKIVYILQDLEKCYNFAKAREKVTKRVVPREVITKSFKNSVETVIQIKEIFGQSVILNLIDRINNSFYENISSKEFFNKVYKNVEEIL